MTGAEDRPLDPPAGAVEPLRPGDAEAMAAQLGRPMRGVVGVAHRCPCTLPDVVATTPRLPDGTPFPTSFYLTCPRAASRVGTLEGGGLMREMTARLGEDPALAEDYAAAHRDYLARRAALSDEEVPEIAGTSAGGMPTRVKCLHVLLAHSLAAGRGTTALGDEVRDLVGAWWAEGACVRPPDDESGPRRPGRES